MKNIKYFPFIRNKYFYGKLLTVDDFETEQKYMNDKRRMMNRFLYGTGVVCGMHVVMIDDCTISIEPGLALDFSGREVVVDLPSVKRLSVIEGFDLFLKTESSKQYLYLCLDYLEQEKDAVHNIAGAATVEYNKYQESYRLSLTDKEPSLNHLSNSDFYENTAVVYLGNGVRISHIMPKYVGTGTEFDIKIMVENMGQMQSIRFKYDLELICMEYNGSQNLRIEFDETNYNKKYKYEMVYQVRANHVVDVLGTMEVKRDSFELYIGGRHAEAEGWQKSAIMIINRDVAEALIQDYYKSAMEDIVKKNYQQSIYLAKIFVIQAGESYVIDDIEQMPFKQYVYNNVLSNMMDQIIMRDEKKNSMFKNQIGQPHERAEIPKPVPDHYSRIACGTAVLDLGIGGVQGQKFFTEEIAHNLGLGNVTIVLGACYDREEAGTVLYGEAGVFDEPGTFKADLAAKADITAGTFKIGLSLTSPTMTRYVNVNWTVIKDIAEDTDHRQEQTLLIKPEILYLNILKNYYLEARLSGGGQTSVNWFVVDSHGGTIEKNGMYTAPNLPGIYEVRAESAIYPALCASMFIVVRDLEH